MSYIDDLFSVTDKSVVITGAGSGLGQHCTQLFSELGCDVAYLDINKTGLAETEKSINHFDNNQLQIHLDVTGEKEVQQAVAAAVKDFGKIDILINCAAIIDYSPMMQVTKDIWDKTYQVDLLGSWFMCKAVAKSMIDNNIEGSIINMSSSLFHRTQKDLIPYNSIKAAVAHMTRSMALELTPYNIRVNALAPGFMKTKMVAEFLETEDGKKAVKSVPFNRAAELREIEGVMVLLASNASSYMTGSIIMIDGGLAFNHIEIPK